MGPEIANCRASTRPLRAWPRYLALPVAAALLWLAADLPLNLLPVRVELFGGPAFVEVHLEGRSSRIPLATPVTELRLADSPPHRREYQIDGTDSTNNFTLDQSYFAEFSSSPYYRFQALLRDEGSYSRWRNLAIFDGDGEMITSRSRPTPGEVIPLPETFRAAIEVRRLETPVALELLDAAGGRRKLEINRNDKYAEVIETSPGRSPASVLKWYYPTDWRPAAGQLGYEALRTLALTLWLLFLLPPLAAILPAISLPRLGERAQTATGLGLVAVALAAGLYAAVYLFDRAPHIMDATSYYFQGKILATGYLAAPEPPVREAFNNPFMVIKDGKWFSQYPPGAPLTYAAGFLLGLPWLVGPALAAGAVLLTFLYARRQYGAGTALVAAALLATSAFLHLIAGSFLSHAPALFYVSLFVYAATRYAEAPGAKWAVLGAAGLGLALLTREVAAGVYAVVVGVFLLAQQLRRRPLTWPAGLLPALACGAGLVAFYLYYNHALTGSPFTPPRHLFFAGDKWGFGEGIGFYGQHTLAAGLVNTEALLTALNFFAFGWPFYFTFALMAAGLLFRRPERWDFVHAGIAGVFVALYVGYFYHGIALGPRYYFEALPSFALLAARGFGALALATAGFLTSWGRRQAVTRALGATSLLFAALLACNVGYFLPRQFHLYEGYVGLPGRGGPALGDFIARDLGGRVSTLDNALVTTGDWWLYFSYFAPLNCPRLDCDTVFAVLPSGKSADRLRQAFPGRTWYAARERAGVIEIEQKLPALPVEVPSAAGPPPPVVVAASAESVVLNLSFDESALSHDGREPASGRYRPAEGVTGGGALLAGDDHLIYSGFSLDARQGAIAFWVKPLWRGDDGLNYLMVEVVGGAGRVRLAKDAASNLRFLISSGGRDGDVSYSVADWLPGEWRHVAATWSAAGTMRLYVDGEKVGESPFRLAPGHWDTARVGISADEVLGCDCVLDEVLLLNDLPTVERADAAN